MGALNHLLLQSGYFNNAHRADDDVWSLFHMLKGEARGEGRSFLDLLIEKSERETYRLTAHGAPFRMKDALKARGYRWNPDRKAWWIECDYAAYLAEKSWLASNDVFNASAEAIDATRRHI